MAVGKTNVQMTGGEVNPITVLYANGYVNNNSPLKPTITFSNTSNVTVTQPSLDNTPLTALSRWVSDGYNTSWNFSFDTSLLKNYNRLALVLSAYLTGSNNGNSNVTAFLFGNTFSTGSLGNSSIKRALVCEIDLKNSDLTKVFRVIQTKYGQDGNTLTVRLQSLVIS